MKRPMLLLAVAVMGAAGVACEEKKPSSDIHTDAGTDKYATADSKLTKALQAVADAAAAATDKGPPPEGIFAPGVADQRHPRGMPTKVDVVSEGASPAISLLVTGDGGGATPASAYGAAGLTVLTQSGPRPGLQLDLGVLFGPAKKDEGGTDWLVGEVKEAHPAKDQMATLSPGTDKDVAGLAGTQLRIKMQADGHESEAVEQLGKGAIPDLDRLAQNALEAVVMTTVPLPAKPVGVGAQWIAETRMQLSGIDVVAYRAYRLKSIEGDRLHLTLDVKSYAATKDVQLSGVPKGATLEQFEAEGQGELELVRGESLARKSDVKQGVVLVFSGPGGPQPAQQPGGPPGNMLTAQLQSRAKFIRGDDMRAAALNK
jgi:hypothetical protein